MFHSSPDGSNVSSRLCRWVNWLEMPWSADRVTSARALFLVRPEQPNVGRVKVDAWMTLCLNKVPLGIVSLTSVFDRCLALTVLEHRGCLTTCKSCVYCMEPVVNADTTSNIELHWRLTNWYYSCSSVRVSEEEFGTSDQLMISYGYAQMQCEMCML